MSPRAERDLDRLPTSEARRIAGAIRRLAGDPRPRGVRKLRGIAPPLWRLRVGTFRVVYSISDRARLVVVSRVVWRSEDTYGT
ncbi:MAG: type II toxin-antitoxin system RelE/ParE family toxin [Dehalococcoidia bacterium]